VYAYIQSYGLKATIVRPFNIYGPRQKSKGFGAVIPIFFRLAMEGGVLKVNGDGNQTRDFLYVDDLVRGYRMISEHPELQGKAINMGSSCETSVLWLAERITSIVGKGSIEHTPARPGEVDSFIADNTLFSSTGFKPAVSMEDGLLKYWQWLQGGQA
jgi:nucleoside-diphosphate-sugar epimerase